MGFLGSIAVGYLAACGTLAAACVVGRGLLRAADSASRGDFEQAREDALASASAPAIMAFDAAATLVNEVAGKASDLAAPAPERSGVTTRR